MLMLPMETKFLVENKIFDLKDLKNDIDSKLIKKILIMNYSELLSNNNLVIEMKVIRKIADKAVVSDEYFSLKFNDRQISIIKNYLRFIKKY